MPLRTDVPSNATTVRRFLERYVSRRTALPIGVALTLLAALGDALTTAEAAFTLFYLVPIGIVAWFRGIRVTSLIIVLVVAASALERVFDEMAMRGENLYPGHWRFVLWNLGMESVLYVFFARLLAAVRALLDREALLRREAIDQLRHSERLSTIGKLAAGMAHELGTPMNVISGRASLIASGKLSATETKSSAVAIGKQVTRMTKIIRNVLDFSRRGGCDKTPALLYDVCRETATLLHPLAASSGIEIEVQAKGELEVAMNRGEIQQVLGNILTNAIHAMPHGGRIKVQAREEGVESEASPSRGPGSKSFAVIEVTDDGEGIAPDVLPHIFDPFFTTKDVGQGTGLGLSVSYGIVSDHGGFIDVKSRLGHGTTFLVYLPL